MNDISQTPMGVALHLPAETAMALALALSDPRVDIPHKRSAAAQAIDDLIAFLDETDGDADLEENGDERDSSWPESHVLRHAVAGAQSEDDEDADPGEDDGTAEPSLGSLGGSSYPWAEPLGWWRVKPYWLTDEEFAARNTPFITPMRGAGGQVDWARGAGSDLEDEHDGAEPDQEDGAAWSEGGSLIGKMDGGWPEDNEASLSLSESMDHSAAIADCQRDDWGVIDGEEDAGERRTVATVNIVCAGISAPAVRPPRPTSQPAGKRRGTAQPPAVSWPAPCACVGQKAPLPSATPTS